MRYLREQEHQETRTDKKYLNLIHETPILKKHIYLFFPQRSFPEEPLRWSEEITSPGSGQRKNPKQSDLTRRETKSWEEKDRKSKSS